MSKVTIDDKVLWIGGIASALAAIAAAVSFFYDGAVWFHDAEEDHDAMPVIQERIREIDTRSRATEEEIQTYKTQQEAKWGKANRERIDYLNEAVQYYEQSRQETDNTSN